MRQISGPWQNLQCYERADLRREDPVAEHGEREREGHAYDGHDEVGGRQVHEVPAQMGHTQTTLRHHVGSKATVLCARGLLGWSFDPHFHALHWS